MRERERERKREKMDRGKKRSLRSEMLINEILFSKRQNGHANEIH